MPLLNAPDRNAVRFSEEPALERELVQAILANEALVALTGEARPARAALLDRFQLGLRPYRARVVRVASPNDQPLDLVMERADEGPDPEQSALDGDRRRHVAASLAALPADAREILVLREIEDLSYKHIASVLDLPVGTVMSRLARAREKMAADLCGRLGRRDHGLSDM